MKLPAVPPCRYKAAHVWEIGEVVNSGLNTFDLHLGGAERISGNIIMDFLQITTRPRDGI